MGLPVLINNECDLLLSLLSLNSTTRVSLAYLQFAQIKTVLTQVSNVDYQVLLYCVPVTQTWSNVTMAIEKLLQCIHICIHIMYTDNHPDGTVETNTYTHHHNKSKVIA